MRISDWSSDVCSSDLLAALDRDACAGVEVRVKHQAVAALAVEPGIQAILVFGNGLGNEVLGRRQVTEARRCADVLALQAIEQLLLGPADVALDQVAAGVFVRFEPPPGTSPVSVGGSTGPRCASSACRVDSTASRSTRDSWSVGNSASASRMRPSSGSSCSAKVWSP